MGCDDGMEPDDNNTKKLTDEFVEFVRKRSETEAPRYASRLKAYVHLKRKRECANAARDKAALKKKADEEQKDQGPKRHDHTRDHGDNERISRSSIQSVASVGDTSEGSFRSLRSSDDDFCAEPFLVARLPARLTIRDDNKVMPRGRAYSRSRSYEPSDQCCCARRRRRRRRRRSCGRRRRGRRRRRSRRRRSCRRSRRRRSCGRGRRRSRRRRSCRSRSRRRRRRSCARRRRRRCRARR